VVVGSLIGHMSVVMCCCWKVRNSFLHFKH
jgi:hypothetical protein